MPIFTVYGKINKKGKHTHRVVNKAIHTFHSMPIDWPDLKNELLTVARNTHFNCEQDQIEISFRHHLPGKFVTDTASYRTLRIRYTRDDEFRAVISYLKLTNEVKVEKAIFITPEFSFQFKESYNTEKHVKFVISRTVPIGFEAMLNNTDPILLFVDQLSTKTVSFLADSRGMYKPMQERRKERSSYQATPRGVYAPRN
jgi:hypothetical protein